MIFPDNVNHILATDPDYKLAHRPLVEAEALLIAKNHLQRGLRDVGDLEGFLQTLREEIPLIELVRQAEVAEVRAAIRAIENWLDMRLSHRRSTRGQPAPESSTVNAPQS